MCISPVELPQTFETVGCRHCWRCRKDRVNDFVGRCIAEQNYSDQTLAVTLTYDDKKLQAAGRAAHAHTLVYKDVQELLKRLRKNYKVRYIVTGEYGSKKGRAHWHCILFLRGTTIPEVRFGDDRKPHQIYTPDQKAGHRINWSPWPWGYSSFQRPDYGGFAYALKYILKDQDAEVARSHLAMSKKPLLGHDFIVDRALNLVNQRLPMNDASYAFRDIFRIGSDGKRYRREFMLSKQSASFTLFCKAYVNLWRWRYSEEPPHSDFLAEKYWAPIWKRLKEREHMETFAPEPSPDRRALVLSYIEHLDIPGIEKMPTQGMQQVWASKEKTLRWLMIQYNMGHGFLIDRKGRKLWELKGHAQVEYATDGLRLLYGNDPFSA